MLASQLQSLSCQRELEFSKREPTILVRFIQLRKPLDEIYSAVLGRPLGNEATRQVEMDDSPRLDRGHSTNPRPLTTGAFGCEHRTNCGKTELSYGQVSNEEDGERP